jgi:hypothetical protein
VCPSTTAVPSSSSLWSTITQPFTWLSSALHSSSEASVVSSVDCVSLPVVTQGNYSPWGDTPLKSASIIKPYNFNLFIHIQNPDQVLGNDENVAKFCKDIRNSNTYFYIDSGLGHNGFDTTLVNAFKLFRKQHTISQDCVASEDSSEARLELRLIENSLSYRRSTQLDDATLTKLVTKKQ